MYTLTLKKIFWICVSLLQQAALAHCLESSFGGKSSALFWQEILSCCDLVKTQSLKAIIKGHCTGGPVGSSSLCVCIAIIEGSEQLAAFPCNLSICCLYSCVV